MNPTASVDPKTEHEIVSGVAPGNDRANDFRCRQSSQSAPAGDNRLVLEKGRLATTKVVRPVIAWRNAETISCSVFGSTEAVGSSRIRIGGWSNMRERASVAAVGHPIGQRRTRQNCVVACGSAGMNSSAEAIRAASCICCNSHKDSRSDVRGDGVREQKALLIYDTIWRRYESSSKSRQVLAISEDPSLLWIVQSWNQAEKRAFACSRLTENADNLTGSSFERNLA